MVLCINYCRKVLNIKQKYSWKTPEEILLSNNFIERFPEQSNKLSGNNYSTSDYRYRYSLQN